MRRFLLLLTMVSLMVVGATGLGLAQAETRTEIFRFPGEFEVGVTCTGQPLVATGVFSGVFHLTEDPQGVSLGGGTSNFQGTAVAADGTEYRIIQSAPNHFTEQPRREESDRTVVGQSVTQMRFISEDGTSDFQLRATFHITMIFNDPDEPEVVIEVSHFETVCTGSQQ